MLRPKEVSRPGRTSAKQGQRGQRRFQSGTPLGSRDDEGEGDFNHDQSIHCATVSTKMLEEQGFFMSNFR